MISTHCSTLNDSTLERILNDVKFLVDDGKFVSYKWVSNSFGIDLNDSKQ